ncbi:MAG: preprotein translocase subunit YajC [Nocardioidaceae bacterium]|nr:preprotein translocase subunit YajC [Nocardioidaceae bacterium]
MNNLAGILPFVLIALVFYFLMIRPQRRRQQTLSATQASLVPGAEVMLTSGIFGRVASLEDETVQLELSPGTVVKVSRQAVVRVVDEDRPELEADQPADPDVDHGPTDPHQ